MNDPIWGPKGYRADKAAAERGWRLPPSGDPYSQGSIDGRLAKQKADFIAENKSFTPTPAWMWVCAIPLVVILADGIMSLGNDTRIGPNDDISDNSEPALSHSELRRRLAVPMEQEITMTVPDVVYPPTSVISCVTVESGVNVRQGPMINSPVIAAVPFNTAVEHAGPLMNVNWQRVEIDSGAQGYIHGDYLQRSPSGLCPA